MSTTEYIPSPQVREWAKAHGWDADHYTEAFNDYLLNRTRKPYKSLDAAFRNCVRSDWFRVRVQKDYVPPRTITERPKYETKTIHGKLEWVNGEWRKA